MPLLADAAECVGKPSPDAQQNLNQVIVGQPKFVRSVPNAQLYQVGSGDDVISVVHLYGTPYEKGFAHDLIAKLGLQVTLELTLAATAPFTPQHFKDEMHGLADATGMHLSLIQHIHMIGELTQGHCSMFGAKDSATPSGGLLQLRALDWDIEGPFQNFPQLTVYHPKSDSDGHAFVNIGWTAWLGSITGMSSNQMAISEIGVSNPDDSFGNESHSGIPFTFILRDILQFDETLEDATHRIKTANRTCNLILGVGDGKDGGSFSGIQYSASVANFYNWSNNHPVAAWHPPITDVVYYGMDWLCPGWDTILSQQLTALHGSITPENTIKNITSIVQTGDLHVAIYDLENMMLYTANARKDGASGPSMAYDRAFVQVNMTDLFAQKQSL